MNRPRAARFADIPALVKLFATVHAASRYATFSGMDSQQAKAVLVSCISQQMTPAGPNVTMTLVCESDGQIDGVLVGVMRRAYEILDILIATDLIFYVRPESHAKVALELRRSFHSWADTWPGTYILRHGVTDAIGDPERSGSLYLTAGFRKAGAIYEKEVRR